MFIRKKDIPKYLILMVACLCMLPMISGAKQNTATNTSINTDPYEVLRYIMIVIAAVLALVIGIMGNAVMVTGRMFWEKQKKDKEQSGASKVLLTIAVSLFVNGLFAQDKTAPQQSLMPSFPTDIYVYITVITVEFLVILFLMYALSVFLDKKKKETVTDMVPAKPKVDWFQKLNKTVPLEKEHTLDLHHEYDGIRELDNNIPSWWKLAFFGTFIFGLVYTYRLYVSESMPNQRQELTMANQQAAIEKLEYLKDAANNIDENNVVLLDSTAVLAGQQLFIKNCVACHGDKGQGNVGPNFTDEYWLHGGSINKIFFSIKYGWQEKGMRSWKDDFSPQQMAQLASFIYSIKNTHVPGGKDKQGELYEEVAGNATAHTSTNN